MKYLVRKMNWIQVDRPCMKEREENQVHTGTPQRLSKTMHIHTYWTSVNGRSTN